MKEKSVRLTDREREVLRLLSEGFTNQEVSEIIMVSVRTVEAHRHRIMLKLRTHDIAGLVKYAIREGLTRTDQHHVATPDVSENAL